MLIQFCLSCWLFLASISVFAAETPSAPDYSSIRFSDVDYSYSETEENKACCGMVTALGKATNASQQKLENPVFEARFFNAEGKLVDAFNDTSYGLRLMPGQEIMVRVMDHARYAASHYASAQIRLVSGDFEDMESPSDSADGLSSVMNFVKQLLMNWGPMLLLIGAWIWMVKRSNALNYQERWIAIVKEQNQTMERQAAALEKMAQMKEEARHRGE